MAKKNGRVRVHYIPKLQKYCTELGKTIYGDIRSPIRWMRTISGTLVDDMKMGQSGVKPCIFISKMSGKIDLALCLVCQ